MSLEYNAVLLLRSLFIKLKRTEREREKYKHTITKWY